MEATLTECGIRLTNCAGFGRFYNDLLRLLGLGRYPVCAVLYTWSGRLV
jgi:hypothetical protein